MNKNCDKKQWMMDLELIFQQAMASGQLAIALKAKELLGKWAGLGQKPKAQTSLKPLSQWSISEIEEFLSQSEAEHREE